MEQNVQIIARDGEYFLAIDGVESDKALVMTPNGRALRLPKNPSNRKKFAISKLDASGVTELTFKPQNTEHKFALISSKLLKFATADEMEVYNRICEATKARWEEDRAARSVRAPKVIDPEVAAAMLEKLYKKRDSINARIAKYEEVVNG